MSRCLRKPRTYDFVPFIGVFASYVSRGIFYPCAHKINHVMTVLMGTAIIRFIYFFIFLVIRFFHPSHHTGHLGKGGGVGGGICIKTMDVQLTEA